MDQEPAVTPAPLAPRFPAPSAPRFPASSSRRFSAFISYSHADERVAARLHREIETYRLPKRLRDRDGADVAGGRLGAVFRDRADLAAADSLSAAIRAALADSGVLIVLCSPDAAGSRWVDAEIRLFREVNPGAPVLAAVVRGEPDAAMPAALTDDGREPLAADLREQGDGRKLGFLKIAAAMAGVPLDALIQRDAQRKLRRVMAVTVGALIALVAAISMMTYAIQQRNEAQAQRAEAERRRTQAEGLVEFMLTDLRDRLRGVGRIDIMRSAVGSALDSYGEGAQRGTLTPDSQGQLARLLHAVGEDDLDANRRGLATEAFQRAYSITAPLLADAPRDADRVFNHAQSEYWVGRIHLVRNDLVRTRPYWQRYHNLALRLNRLEPNSTRSLRELAYGRGNLCTVELAQRRPGLALCRASYEPLAQLARLQPDDPTALRDLANRAGWLADALQRAGEVEEALSFRARQLTVARQLYHLDRQNWEHREYLVRALYSVASANFHFGNAGEAVPVRDEAVGHIRAMRAHDRENERWANLAELIDGLRAQ